MGVVGDEFQPRTLGIENLAAAGYESQPVRLGGLTA